MTNIAQTINCRRYRSWRKCRQRKGLGYQRRKGFYRREEELILRHKKIKQDSFRAVLLFSFWVISHAQLPLHKTQKNGEVKDLAIGFLYYFLASRAEIDSIIFDIFSSAFASFAFSASISCAGAFARKP